MELMRKDKIPASITLAQGILESGCGNSELARNANNHFGIKCKPEWMGVKYYYDDDAKQECFRKYKSDFAIICTETLPDKFFFSLKNMCKSNNGPRNFQIYHNKIKGCRTCFLKVRKTGV